MEKKKKIYIDISEFNRKLFLDFKSGRYAIYDEDGNLLGTTNNPEEDLNQGGQIESIHKA